MSKTAQETEMRCVKCHEKVWLEDGDYSCDCLAANQHYLQTMGSNFPKEWVDEDHEVHE
jgi:hypothetical protein